MNTSARTILLAVTTAVSMTIGCAPKSNYQEVGGTDSLVTSGVNTQDVLMTSQQILAELDQDGLFPSPPQPRAKVLIENVINRTDTPFDLTILRNGVVRQLVNLRKIEVLAADSRGSQVSEAAQAIQREKAFKGETIDAEPEWIIQMTLINKSTQSNKTTQSNIWINIDFIDARTGSILFIGEGAIQKQVSKPGLRL
jgi:PBP1b-binding outer membrane lipoprotein LpoB